MIPRGTNSCYLNAAGIYSSREGDVGSEMSSTRACDLNNKMHLSYQLYMLEQYLPEQCLPIHMPYRQPLTACSEALPEW